MHPFRRLSVWEKAHALTLMIYPITEGQMLRRFPSLAQQLRRSVSSIPANIVEGAGLGSQAQFNRHLTIALASAREAEYHLLLAKDLGAIDLKTFATLEARLGEVQAMLNSLGRRVRERIAAPSTSKRRAGSRT
ncbi:MAG TPA: four helix bundle protein [Gemmatimonadaceae bacterium]|nr:four helix bundle protein [Gemmatimonadaceae bacterium]HRQ77499.1 four helix bundle protein [Gemmatimonadaceae bacterium]